MKYTLANASLSLDFYLSLYFCLDVLCVLIPFHQDDTYVDQSARIQLHAGEAISKHMCRSWLNGMKRKIIHTHIDNMHRHIHVGWDVCLRLLGVKRARHTVRLSKW